MEPPFRIADAVARLKNVFLEDPGVRISTADMSRLSGVDATICDVILQTLEDARFIQRRPDGRFARASE
jgi:hypothetical protein